MGFIKRLSHEKKLERQTKIGAYISCPMCLKSDGLATWEGERYLKCQHCGANYQKKQKFVPSRDGKEYIESKGKKKNDKI